MQHLIDTPMELANCDKCKAYVFKCDVSGIRTIVDCGPLDGMDDVRRRLMMGRSVYRILPGRKLAQFAPLSTNTEGGYLVEHWCTAGTTGAKAVEVAPVGPHQAPATPGGPKGGFHHPTVPGSGSQGHTGLPIMKTRPTDSSGASPSRALNATPRLSRHIKPTRCDTCGVVIHHDTPDVFSIEHDGRLVYAQHVAC